MALPKLNKLLLQGITACGITDLKPFQEKLFSRINGGASLYLLGADGTGKTTGMMISVLQRLNYSQPDTPRVIVMMSKSEDATELYNRFKVMAQHMDLQIHLVTEEGIMDEQNMAIYAGADLIIGTPVRLTKLYFQCGINVNKVNLLVLDNAFKLVENRQLVELDRFTDSLSKFQSIVIETELNPRLQKACAKFIPYAQELLAE
ncbi:MAG: DEAD/DEAH box helicase [Bacteroidetes bacterium]|nr:DEAD/DEAH box helicase [Bacteroidota bacterium]